MAGPTKRIVRREQFTRTTGTASTSSDHSSKSNTSSSGPETSMGYAASEGGSTYRSSASHSGGYDGNRDPGAPQMERNPATARPVVDPKDFDMGIAGWSVVRGYTLPAQMVPRPKPSTLGKSVQIALNTYEVTALPNANVYQFDVQIGSGVEKRGLIRAAWESKTVAKELGQGWVFDGNKLAWHTKPIDREIRLTIDLDAERGRTPRSDKENKVRISIRQTNRVRIDTLRAYLDGKVSFDNACLESLNCIDHVLRETPSLHYTQIKRSFFHKDKSAKRFDLGGCVEALKGVYQSARIVHKGLGKAVVSINADVSNGMFWVNMPLHQACVLLTGRRDIGDLMNSLRQGGDRSSAGQTLKKIRRIRVQAKHRGKSELDEYVIDRLVYQSARQYAFEKDGKRITLYDYFAKVYNIRLQYPDLPLVQMTKGKNTVLPMEVLMIKPDQRYNYKCDEKQTAQMIKFAVTPPSERYASIDAGLKMLNWGNDPVLKNFGIGVTDKRTIVEGRVLNPPTVAFAGGEAKPGTSGRWDLKGKKFLKPNPTPLKSWAVCVVPGRRGGKPDKSIVENFIREFVKIYTNHGGKVENKQPAFQLAQGDDVGSWVTSSWNAAGNQVQARPQMLVFILPDKDSTVYGRIKRSAECRYGVVTQCMQYAHVQKAQPQYISNVCMKFNAKLGGITCRATGMKSKGPNGLFTQSTMVIGADVSHAAPGTTTPSMAALTVSMDALATRYAAACETNGFRTEMITTDNINSLLKPMMQHWTQNVGGGKFPTRIIYFRDGVSEGQYQHVLQQEVADMKALLRTANPAMNIQFIVVVGSKRHHVRFFPKDGDRNGNPLPGTLVESGATNPFENDFYLCSHAAIKGTARPMHYQVILNEAEMSNEELQTIIYEHCYQYIRATTPVSQHPAIYYAHIASNRAITHDPKWGGSSDGISGSGPAAKSASKSGSQSGSQGARSGDRSGGSSSGMPSEVDKLMPMPNQGGINTSMWYI